ncbi:MAG TPA: site-specific integrase [Acidimicrobiales bacterium]|nr:site-specific integrase [Acidimicrobiales bacterium]
MATRRRAFGSIRQVGRTSWEASYKVDGQRYTAPKTFLAKADASAWLANVQADINRGVWIDPTGGRQTLGQFAAGWLDRARKTGRYRPRSEELVTWLLDKYVLPELASCALSDLKTARIRRWHADLVAKHGQGQAAKAYRVLRTMLGEAAQDGLIVANPCNIKGAGQQPVRERPSLGLDQVQEVAHALALRPRLCCNRGHLQSEHEADYRYEALVWTAALAGLREGELFALERRDVDLLHKTISVSKQAQTVAGERHVGPPKSAAGERSVAIPASLAAVLEKHLATYVGAEPHALVFTSEMGAPLERHLWARTWRRAAKAAGHEGVHFHDTRHCALTFYAQLGATTKELMALAGHSTMSVALTYQHATNERQREIADKMEEALRRRSASAEGIT